VLIAWTSNSRTALSQHAREGPRLPLLLIRGHALAVAV
jgi:hypothetical protein